MPNLGSLRDYIVLVTCVLAACGVTRTDAALEGAAGASSAAGESAQGGRAQPSAAGRGGRSGDPDAGTRRMAGAGGASDAGLDAGSSGVEADGGLASQGGRSPTDPPDAGGPGDAGGEVEPSSDSCAIDGGCPSFCPSTSAQCGALNAPIGCEFTELAGLTVDVTCGTVATLTHVECGICGPIDVKVYFDGVHCWQGLPDCALPNFAGQFLLPHSPGATR